jgi:hypothetical protein
MRRMLIAFLTLVAAGSSAAANPPPRVTLALLPATILPGLPAGFLLTVTNPSAQPVVVADFAGLKVATSSGAFSAVGLDGRQTIHLPSEQMAKCNSAHCLTVPANAQRQLYLRFGPALVENEFFSDRRLSVPGRYDLVVSLWIVDSTAVGTTEIDSDVQTLTVQQPTGDDLLVWNFLQQTSKGNGWSTLDWIQAGEGVAANMRSTFPKSGYAAWVGAIDPRPHSTVLASQLSQLDGALAGNPPAAVRDELLLAKGILLQGWSNSTLFVDRDADGAVSLSDQARSVLLQLQDVALTDLTRAKVADALSHLMTRATALEEIRSLAAGDAPAPAAVVPRVECVSPGTGQSFSARFGYSNPNRAIKVLQIGSDNQVTPAPREQGQPRVFKPGDHSGVFVATSPGGNLIWHLDGGTATATADFTARCSP